MTPPLDINGGPEEALDAFMSWIGSLGIDLYGHQELAVISIFDDNHVVMATPTGSGKSLIAYAQAAYSRSVGRRWYYTAPIKALVSEKFFELRQLFGPEHVGMLTGDAAIQPDAPLICATAEILALDVLNGRAPIGAVAMDEFHFFADPQRGWAWELPLIAAQDVQFVLMSATLGHTGWVADHLGATTRDCQVINGTTRPVPLSFHYAETPLIETIHDLVETNLTPTYVVHFAQRQAGETAQQVISAGLGLPNRAEIAERVRAFRFDTPYGAEFKKCLLNGVGIHHGGILPKYRLLVEHLAAEGYLSVICGTDTLGVGVNVPIRSVLLTQLCRYDGNRTRIASVRDFHQIAGRAGRRGFDTEGSVWVQAPAHVIENARSAAKAAQSGRKRSVQKRKPPEWGYQHWDRSTFDRLVHGEPETLRSAFRLTEGAIVQLARAAEDLEADAHRLIDRSFSLHPSELHQTADAMIDALIEGGVLVRNTARNDRAELHPSLAENFSVLGELSGFALAAIRSADPEDPDWVAFVLAVIESTIEDPVAIRKAMREQARSEKYHQLKAAGVPFEERQELLADITDPQPFGDELGRMYLSYQSDHAWLRGIEIAPKGIVAEMYGAGDTFGTFIQRFKIKRLEGTLLRYLGEVWKASTRTVPGELVNEEWEEFLAWLSSVIRRVDASLIDEWERLQRLAGGHEVDSAPSMTYDLAEDHPALLAEIRREAFRVIEWISRGRWEDLWERRLHPSIDRETFDEIARSFPTDAISIAQPARSRAYCQVSPQQERVQQLVVDEHGDTIGWFDLAIDLTATRAAQELCYAIDLGSLTIA